MHPNTIREAGICVLITGWTSICAFQKNNSDFVSSDHRTVLHVVSACSVWAQISWHAVDEANLFKKIWSSSSFTFVPLPVIDLGSAFFRCVASRFWKITKPHRTCAGCSSCYCIVISLLMLITFNNIYLVSLSSGQVFMNHFNVIPTVQFSLFMNIFSWYVTCLSCSVLPDVLKGTRGSFFFYSVFDKKVMKLCCF